MVGALGRFELSLGISIAEIGMEIQKRHNFVL